MNKINEQESIRSNAPIYAILIAAGTTHLLHDLLQAVLPALNPLLVKYHSFSYTELGWIAFALNATSAILQPLIGYWNDKKPVPYALPSGLLLTVIAMVILAFSGSFWPVLIAAILIGLGSAVFHPECVRVVALAAGNRRGLAQSIFQVGGNSGQAFAPLLTILLFAPFGQEAAFVCAGIALITAIILYRMAKWATHLGRQNQTGRTNLQMNRISISKWMAYFSLGLLLFLAFARSWYYIGIANYYSLFQMEALKTTLNQAQMYVFTFLAAGAVGTFFGGVCSDRFGRKNVILFSIVASIPFTLWLPYCGAISAYFVLFMIGLILLSSFSVVVVYVQDLFPNHKGTVSGLVIGFAFGIGAIGAVILGWLAEHFGLPLVMNVLSFLPIIGLVVWFLPDDRKHGNVQTV